MQNEVFEAVPDKNLYVRFVIPTTRRNHEFSSITSVPLQYLAPPKQLE